MIEFFNNILYSRSICMYEGLLMMLFLGYDFFQKTKELSYISVPTAVLLSVGSLRGRTITRPGRDIGNEHNNDYLFGIFCISFCSSSVSFLVWIMQTPDVLYIGWVYALLSWFNNRIWRALNGVIKIIIIICSHHHHQSLDKFNSHVTL